MKESFPLLRSATRAFCFSFAVHARSWRQWVQLGSIALLLVVLGSMAARSVGLIVVLLAVVLASEVGATRWLPTHRRWLTPGVLRCAGFVVGLWLERALWSVAFGATALVGIVQLHHAEANWDGIGRSLLSIVHATAFTLFFSIAAGRAWAIVVFVLTNVFVMLMLGSLAQGAFASWAIHVGATLAPLTAASTLSGAQLLAVTVLSTFFFIGCCMVAGCR